MKSSSISFHARLSKLSNDKEKTIHLQISDSETIERQSHGYTRDEIPDMEEVVRIDVVGGFALQKVTADRSYFR